MDMQKSTVLEMQSSFSTCMTVSSISLGSPEKQSLGENEKERERERERERLRDRDRETEK